MTVAGLLLAAGGGRRFGAPKAGVRFGDQTLAERGAQMLAAAGCAPVVVVVGASDPFQGRPPAHVTLVVNPHWEQGLSTSLQAGIAALAPTSAEALVVALADQPLITPAAVIRLVQAWDRGAVAAAASYDGRLRNPVLFDRSVWADVAAAAAGEEGARSWLRANGQIVEAVPCDDVASPADVDTPHDLARLAEAQQQQRTTTNEGTVPHAARFL